MVRLMTIQEDVLFTEGADNTGRFWRASIAPNRYAKTTNEGYLDHRITDQYEDAIGQDFDAEGEEEEFTGRDLAGINSTPEAGAMGTGEEAPGDLGAFDTPPGMAGGTAPATDETEVPPAAIPRAMPDMIAQAMQAQIPGMSSEPDMQGIEQSMNPGMDMEQSMDMHGTEPGMDMQGMEQGMQDMQGMEPGNPEPGMQPGQTDQLDMEQPPARPGPGEEMPTPQTGARAIAQPQVVQPQVMQGPMAIPGQQQIVQPQAAQPQIEPEFGQDGADYTIDPFLNSLKGIVNDKEASPPQSPRTINEPTTGARTQQSNLYGGPKRYSKRMREAREHRLGILND